MHAAVSYRKDAMVALCANQVGAKGSRSSSQSERNENDNNHSSCAQGAAEYAVAWQGGATAERVEGSDVKKCGEWGLDERG